MFLQSGVAGTQCTMIAFTALIYAYCGLFSPDTLLLDKIIVHGHNLFVEYLIRSNSRNARMLAHFELPRYLLLNGFFVKCNIIVDRYFGVIGQGSESIELNNAVAQVGSSTIEQALCNVMSEHRYALLTIGTYSYALFQYGDNIVFFDSHCGLNEVANAIYFRNIVALSVYLCDKFSLTLLEFNVSPIHMVSVENRDNPITDALIVDIVPHISVDYEQIRKLVTCSAEVDGNCTDVVAHDATSQGLAREHTDWSEYTRATCENSWSHARHSHDTVQSNSNTKMSNVHNVVDTNESRNRHSDKISDIVSYCVTKVRENALDDEATAELAHETVQGVVQEVRDETLQRHISAFRDVMSDLPNRFCFCCNRFLFNTQIAVCSNYDRLTELTLVPENATFCYTCAGKLKKGNIPARCWLNELEAPETPTCLKELNFVEKRFLAMVQTYMSLIALPGGQYSQRGLAIHFPFSVNSGVRILPQTLSNLPLLCVVGSLSMVVRHDRILMGLEWLKDHNPLYADVEINYGNVETNSPVEADLTGIDDNVDQSGSIPCNAENISIEFPKSSGYPISYGDVPDSEPKAFPWLFPYGKNHMHTIRKIKLSLLEYYQTRLLNRNNMYRLDIPYLIVAVNHWEKCTLNSIIGIYMKICKCVEVNTESEIVNVKAKDVSGKKMKELAGHSDSYMFAKKIRGTAAYWKNELYNLLSRIKSLGPPDLFLTLSAADTQWKDLKNILAYDMSENCATTNSVALLKRNPVMTAVCFERRWRYFLQHILTKAPQVLGNVNDYWARIEFQNRGSPHVHLFLWISEAPSLRKSSSESEIVAYVDKIISTEIPVDAELRQLVLALQTHSHTSTCQKNNRSKTCRFHYPRNVCNATHILDENNMRSGKTFYETKRSNDAVFINAYNPTLIKIWKGNMDIQMVNGILGVAHYVCNYVCKAEPKELTSELASLFEEFSSAGTNLGDREKMFRTGMCLLRCRQMSAQEAAFRICHLPLIYSSREIVFLNTAPLTSRMKRLKSVAELKELEDDSEEVFIDSFLDKYRKRPSSMEGMSLYEVASWYTITAAGKRKSGSQDNESQYSFKKRSKFACVRINCYQLHSEYYYYGLLLLHVPHRADTDLQVAESWSESFCESFDLINQETIANERILNELLESSSRLKLMKQLKRVSTEAESENAPRVESDVAQATVTAMPLFDETLYNVSRSESKIWDAFKRNTQHSNVTEPERLTDDQKFALRYIESFLVKGKPARVFLTGEAGTGKTHLLREIISRLRLHFQTVDESQTVLVTAPTGIAAINIGGVTLHSALCLPVQHGKQPECTELSNKALKKLRQLFQNLKCIIIDEVSMVSDKMLNSVHSRLCTILNCVNDEPFANLHIIVSGDFFQLRPVRGKYAFNNEQLWQLFQPIYLFQNVRQGNDLEYAKLLSRARYGLLNKEDIACLSSRILDQHAAFPSTELHLYPTRKMAQTFNANRQMNLNSADIEIKASDIFSYNDIAGGCQVPEHLVPKDDRDAGGYPLNLTVSKGTRVMLLRNLFTEYRLVNGTLGIISSILMDCETDIVETICVKFDDIEVGVPFQNSEDGTIKIQRSTVDYAYKGRYISRLQFPLCPAWACTFHKAQGLSLSSASISIGREIFAPGQAYVGLSRITELKGLWLESLCPQKVYPDSVVLVHESTMMKRFFDLKALNSAL